MAFALITFHLSVMEPTKSLIRGVVSAKTLPAAPTELSLGAGDAKELFPQYVPAKPGLSAVIVF
jgi:hypothetical protein